MKTLKRQACRAILLTSEGEVFLIRVGNPDNQWSGWITPGGGLEEGESAEEGLRRELSEELSLSYTGNGLPVWKRFHRFPWNGTWFEQHEVFYLIPSEKFPPPSSAGLTETEMLDFQEMRWWKVDEIISSPEEFAPRNLGRLLEELIRNGTPSDPIDAGI